MIQARVAGSGMPFFHHERDLLHLFPHIGQLATNRLHESLFHPAIQYLAGQTGLSNADLVAAAIALREFVNGAANPAPSADDCNTVYVNAGFDKVKPAALLALFFQIGIGTMSFYFDFVRKAVERGRQVPMGSALGDHIDRIVHALATDDPAAARRRRADADAAGNLSDGVAAPAPKE